MIDMGDFRNKMTIAGVETDSDLYNALSEAMVVLSAWNLSEADLKFGLSLISEYGLKQLDKLPLIPEDAWVPFDYGNVRPGEFVKVAPNAYDSTTGAVHNNRLGVVIEVSGHRATVRYITDKVHTNMRHPISRLLSLKYVIKSKFNPTP